MPPELTGGFLTMGPPRKSQAKLFLNNKTYIEMKTKQKTSAVTGMAGRLGSAGSLMGRPIHDLRVARLPEFSFFFN